MFNLYDNLQPGSFRACYADTDSMCLALTRSIKVEENDDLETRLRKIFDPIVRPDRRDVWEQTWRDWFVTTTDVEDQRKPGKLKGELSYHMNHMIYYICSGIQFRKGVFRGLESKMLYCLQFCEQNKKDWDERCST